MAVHWISYKLGEKFPGYCAQYLDSRLKIEVIQFRIKLSCVSHTKFERNLLVNVQLKANTKEYFFLLMLLLIRFCLLMD